MMIEFVAIDENGVERDWVDPIEAVEESEHFYIVSNGYSDYAIKKYLGWQYIQRVKVVSNGH